MKIPGTPIANTILEHLKSQIARIEVTPHLAIILATTNPAPKMYVSIKLRRAAEIGLKTTVYEFNSYDQELCLTTINELNNDPIVHGILVQLPMHEGWDQNQYVNAVLPTKDVDGFLPDSQFKPATGLAVWEMLTAFAQHESFVTTHDFLKNKKITVVGKGKTAGKPTIDILTSEGFLPTVIDSKTQNPDEILKTSDIIISAVGKRNLITADNIKESSYILGIGVGKELREGKERIYGDIDEESIQHKAKLYCPTIGGIGPLTIACLLRNVVNGAMKSAQ